MLKISALLCTISVIVLSAIPSYGFNYGVCLGVRFQSTDVTEQAFRLLSEAGVSWLRTDFVWRNIEQKEGEYNFERYDELVEVAKKHNIKILGLISSAPEWSSGSKDISAPPKDLAAWERFVKVMVGRYKNDITHWQIWNEPDIEKFWEGTPAEYIDLLKIAHRVIKAVDPSINVVSGGLDGRGEKYLPQLLELGLASYVDIIAFHPYGKTPERSVEKVKKIISILEKNNIKKPLWFTEIGWQAGGKAYDIAIVDSEETKAAYLRQVFHLLKPYGDAIFWFNGVDIPGAFGLIERNEARLKIVPAYKAYTEAVGHVK